MIAPTRHSLARWIVPGVVVAGAFLLGRMSDPAPPAPAPVAPTPAVEFHVDADALVSLLTTPIELGAWEAEVLGLGPATDRRGAVRRGGGRPAGGDVDPDQALDALLGGPLGDYLGPEARALLEGYVGRMVPELEALGN